MDSVIDAIAANQRTASDPASNVWVNASAGSGKTKVLIDRLLRLLLAGAKPQSIVCITFTQAAAIEMRHRLQSVLERWLTLPSLELTKQLQQLDPGLSIDESLLVKVRLLYNHVLDEPVNIETIHSFAQSILASAYPENKLPYGSTLMDEVTMQSLIKNAAAGVFDPANFNKDLKQIYTLFSSAKFYDVVEKIRSDQAFFRFLLLDGLDAFDQKLKTYLRSPRDVQAILGEAMMTLAQFDLPIQESPEATENDSLLIQRLRDALKSKTFEAVKEVLLTDKGTPRKRLLSKKMCDVYPEISTGLFVLADQMFEWDQEIRRSRTLETTLLVVRLADAFLGKYAELKHQKGLMDYDDLIFKTLEVLSNSAVSQNVLYKLDRIVDHILVDEAQDTNLYQWKLIDYILESFFQNEIHKTLFVVGDHKQAIFGFQGTDPDIFHQIKDYYRNKPSLRSWKDVSLDISFRSLQGVLDFVDRIFQTKGLIAEYKSHRSFHGNGGRVIVHPLCTLEEGDEERLHTRFAEQVVKVIQDTIGTEVVYKGKPHVVQPKDILLLIRKRGEYLNDLQAELTNHQIPFSSPNRQSLYEDPLVQFILQSIAVITQPRDEATFMQWCLNPLLGIGHQAIQWGMDRLLKNESLESFVALEPKYAMLKSAVKDFTSLDDLYMKVLIWSKDHLPIDSQHLQNALILGELLKTWSLQGNLRYTSSEVINYVKTLQIPQVNRTDNEALRILTVHGAKGLQAPIVMLVDTTQLPISRGALRYDDRMSVFLCSSKAKDEPIEYETLKADQKQKELTEYYRLLYVALTRAEIELHVFGATKAKVSEDSWYLISAELFNQN